VLIFVRLTHYTTFKILCIPNAEHLLQRGIEVAGIGQPVSALALNYGPPTAQFDAGNGRMAFQWEHHGMGQTPGMATRVGPTVLYNAPQAYATMCRVSIIAAPATCVARGLDGLELAMHGQWLCLSSLG